MFKKFVLSCLILTSCCLTFRTAQAWEFRAGVRGYNILGEYMDELSKFAISFADLAAYYNPTSNTSIGLSYSFNKHSFTSDLDDDDEIKVKDKQFNWHEIGLDFIWDFFKVSKLSLSARTTVNLVNKINFKFKFGDEELTSDVDYDFKVQLPLNFRVGTGINYNVTDNLKLYSDLLVQFSKLKVDKVNVSLNFDNLIRSRYPAFDGMTDPQKEAIREAIRAEVSGEIEEAKELFGEGEKTKIYGIAMSIGVRYLL